MSVLIAKGLTKRYGGVLALDDASLTLNAGEVLGLLGANGSGKSTLSSIVAGDRMPDHGSLEIDGVPLAPGSPKAARAAGIAIAHQHPGLAPDLPVWENVFLGAEPCRAARFLDQPRARERARRLLESLRPGWDIEANAGALTAADQQLVEIARALALEPRVLILDEPTAALAAAEVESLIRVVRALTARGTAVVFISHRMAEIAALCDRVMVLCNGRQVGELPVSGRLDEALVLEMMGGAAAPQSRGGDGRERRVNGRVDGRVDERVNERVDERVDGQANERRGEREVERRVEEEAGREAEREAERLAEREVEREVEREAEQGEAGVGGREEARTTARSAAQAKAQPKARTAARGAHAQRHIALRVRGLRAGARLRGVDFAVERGEVLGIAGLQGHGQEELLDALAGFRAPDGGELTLNGRAGERTITPGSPRQMIAAGVCLVPNDRHRQGLWLDHSVEFNLAQVGVNFDASPWRLRRAPLRRFVDEVVARLRIKTSDVRQPVRELSGGNQQKVVIGRWLNRPVDVLLLSDPTKGVDVIARREIYEAIGALADAGTAVLVYASDTDELLAVCDRLIVMYEGRIVTELEGEEMNESRVTSALFGRSAA